MSWSESIRSRTMFDKRVNLIRLISWISFLFSSLLFIRCGGSSELALTPEERKLIFVSDDIYNGLVPTFMNLWKKLVADIKNETLLKDNYEEQQFWDTVVFNQLKPHHRLIREVDRVVLANKPAKLLNDLVNITNLEDALDLSARVTDPVAKIAWLEVVKDGWIKVAGMMAQLHFDYDWIFDHVYSKSHLNDIDVDFLYISDSLKKYFNWYNTKSLDITSPALDTIDLIYMSKQVILGVYGLEYNLFAGLKMMLNQEEERVENLLNPDRSPTADICIGNDTIAGKRNSKRFHYVPVYVLLHLLNGEFKYFIMKNVAAMYKCLRTKKCDMKTSMETTKQLRKFYAFFFNGIVITFDDITEKTPNVFAIPKTSWRWRCDPPANLSENSANPGNTQHVEGVTYTRFYDYETVFLMEETDLSLTKTCRDTCTMFDGSYSSIPCAENDWDCLGSDKNFDCMDLRKKNLSCPDPPRKICPNDGLKCVTTSMTNVKFCDGQRDSRYIEWAETTRGTVMGKKTECSESDLKNVSAKLEVYERSGIIKFEPENCEICLCKCFEPITNQSHRYISLEAEMADIKNQRAIVGIKFVKIGSIIYPQIAQAEVKFGLPNPATLEWIEPKLQNLSDTSSKIFRLGRKSNKILLDDILAPPGFVITGIGLGRMGRQKVGDYALDSESNDGKDGERKWVFKSIESELMLEVHMTQLNQYGFLNPNMTFWKSNSQSRSARRKAVSTSNSDEPTLSTSPSQINSMSNQYISVQGTSLRKDAGQTPVPFFDAQDLVETRNMTLIRGLGLFYKSQPGFGGFLGFRMIPMPIIHDVPENRKYDLWHSFRR